MSDRTPEADFETLAYEDRVKPSYSFFRSERGIIIRQNIGIGSFMFGATLMGAGLLGPTEYGPGLFISGGILAITGAITFGTSPER